MTRVGRKALEVGIESCIEDDWVVGKEGGDQIWSGKGGEDSTWSARQSATLASSLYSPWISFFALSTSIVGELDTLAPQR